MTETPLIKMRRIEPVDDGPNTASVSADQVDEWTAAGWARDEGKTVADKAEGDEPIAKPSKRKK